MTCGRLAHLGRRDSLLWGSGSYPRATRGLPEGVRMATRGFGGEGELRLPEGCRAGTAAGPSAGLTAAATAALLEWEGAQDTILRSVLPARAITAARGKLSRSSTSMYR